MNRRSVDIDSAEELRRAAQVSFDQASSQLKRNKLGQFATPANLAVEMLRVTSSYFPESMPIRFLDPAVGTGVFYSAVLKVYNHKRIVSATGFEIDNRAVEIAKDLWSPLGLRVCCQDFTQAVPPKSEREKYNLVVCNPPYVRHHHLTQITKASLKVKAETLGLGVSGLMGLYGYFLLIADQWLAKNGSSIWIVPAELLDVNYGVTLKRYLVSRVETLRVHRYDPADVQFADALVTSVILFFQKNEPAKDNCIKFTSGPDLLHPSFQRNVVLSDLDPEMKWGKLFRSSKVARLSKHPHTLSEIFRIKRGLATGSNSFFILEKSHAERLGLPKEFLRPILPSPRLLKSETINSDKEGFPLGLTRLVLFDCALPKSALKEHYPAAYDYLMLGERKGLLDLYLAKSRTPWYVQEQRPPAPILCTYMGRKKKSGPPLRFIRNCSQATAHNVYLLLYPKERLALAAKVYPNIVDEVFEHLQSVSDIHLLGRVYGGGLNKLEPRELANLEIPIRLIDRIKTLSEAAESSCEQKLMWS